MPHFFPLAHTRTDQGTPKEQISGSQSDLVKHWEKLRSYFTCMAKHPFLLMFLDHLLVPITKYCVLPPPATLKSKT